MLYTLENDSIIIKAHCHGGELHNITSKKTGTEYLWNGDATYWKYHAPVLFPIVGKVIDGKYRVDGNIYELPQHGLARISEFTMIEKTDDSICFELIANEDTLKVYPYKFSLKITYTLLDKGVRTTYTVTNLDDKKIFFSIGAHPAYLCPIEEGDSQQNCYFEFDCNENAETMLLDPKTGYFSDRRELFLKDTNRIDITKDLFINDALIFDSLKSNKVSIKSNSSKKSLTMDFSGFPYMALWSQATGAPFVCLEPWYGHADYTDFKGELKDKEGIQSLEIGESFNCHYDVTITE